MTSMKEVVCAMDALEEGVSAVLTNPHLTPLERRLALDGLLRRYHVLEEYKAALAAFISRMRGREQEPFLDPEEVVREILASPEFMALRLAVLATIIAVVYGGGPRSAWVPVALLPLVVVPCRWP